MGSRFWESFFRKDNIGFGEQGILDFGNYCRGMDLFQVPLILRIR